MAQVFSCEFCEISKNTFFYRIPPVAASAHLSFRQKCAIWWPCVCFLFFTQFRLLKVVSVSVTLSVNFSPAGIYLLKNNNKNTRTICEICLKLTIKTPEWRICRCSGAFTVNFEQISYIVVVILLLNLNKQIPAGSKNQNC